MAAKDPIATHAARLYTRILGQTLADLALIHLPYGGIYLIGGMARAMSPHFAGFGLTATFREPRRVDLLEKDFAVWVVEDDFAALTGCAAWLDAQTRLTPAAVPSEIAAPHPGHRARSRARCPA